jgi:hypothetical protein
LSILFKVSTDSKITENLLKLFFFCQARPFLQQNVPKGDYSILDPSLLNQFNPKSLEIVSNLALRCTENYGIKRPIMSEVLRELKRALAVEDGVSLEMAYKQSPRVSEEMPFSAITPR